jgi:PAS domain S-box-containing protein
MKINQQQIEKLFPFFIQLNKKGECLAVGPSLIKLVNIPIAKPCSSFLKIHQPQLGDFSLLEYWKDQDGKQASIQIEQYILLGSWNIIDDSVFFFGVPQFDSIQSFHTSGLQPTDFAPQDTSVHWVKQFAADFEYNNDLQELFAILKNQREQIKEAQLQLRKNNDQLLAILNNLSSCVILEDGKRNVLTLNRPFCDLLNIQLSPTNFSGLANEALAEYFAPFLGGSQAWNHLANPILDGFKPVLDFEMPTWSDGRIVSLSYVPIRFDDKSINHLWIFKDRTIERNAEKTLRLREERYRNIIANMNLGLLEVDLEERILSTNKSFCEMSGYLEGELIGAKASELFIQDNLTKEEHKAILERRTNLQSDAYQLKVKNKFKQPRWWLVSGAPLLNDQGEVIGSIGIHLDITSQKETESELIVARDSARESSKAKESFLANMSHEIRTPMNAILGMSKQLSKTKLNKEQAFFNSTIVTAADNLLVILNDILDISKIEAGKLSVEHIPFNLKDLVTKLYNLMEMKAKEKALRINLHFDIDLPNNLIGDPYRLNQILYNLVGNAIKFTDKGHINIKCKLVEDAVDKCRVDISVKDTGIGMDENFATHLFEKFSQEDLSITRRFGGTGLGLSISKQLSELMGGGISLQSKKGEGSTFTLHLPFMKSDAESTQLEETTTVLSPIALLGKRILLAEDNELNRIVAVTTLQSFGAEVIESENGLRAIDLLKSRAHFDIVLMDLSMPEMDGLMATRTIRQELKMNIPIIALTANAILGEKQKCLNEGMDDYISKPFEELDLVRMILKYTNENSGIENNVTAALVSNTNDDEAVSLPRGMFTPADEPVLANASPSYSYARLEKMGNGNKELVRKIREVFLKQMPSSLSELELAVRQRDYDQVYMVAHRSKSSLVSFSAEEAKELANRMEVIAKEKGSFDEIDAHFNQFTAIVNNILIMMEQDIV